MSTFDEPTPEDEPRRDAEHEPTEEHDPIEVETDAEHGENTDADKGDEGAEDGLDE